MVPEFREVRVTARPSIRTPFVAPDMAPVPTHNVELEKISGRDWTDFDNKPQLTYQERDRRKRSAEVRAERVLGVVQRSNSTPGSVVRSTNGPSAAYLAAKAKAEAKHSTRKGRRRK